MFWTVILLISVSILGMLLFAGYLLGRTITSYRYAKKIDEKNKIIDDLTDKLHIIYEDVRKGKFDRWKKKEN